MSPDAFPSSLAGTYRPVRLLASGGFGAVWEAVEAGGRHVALKLPREMQSVSASELGRFMAEARLTAALVHPHVVKVYACSGPDEPVPWIAYELLSGATLRDWLVAARPAPAALVEVGRQIASALAAAHAAGVVHRDIKPENVLAGADGRFKVTDFGVARFSDNPVKTKTGIVLGTPAYMPPEVIRGDRATPATDLYALGVILYEGLTGRVPNHSDDALQLLMGRLHNPPDPVLARAPDAPRYLAELVDHMVALDPAARLPTAVAVLSALDACLPAERTGRQPRDRSRPTLARVAPASGGARTVAVRASAPRIKARWAALLALPVALAIAHHVYTSRKIETFSVEPAPGVTSASPIAEGPPAGDPRQVEVTRYAGLVPPGPTPLPAWDCDEPGAPARAPLVLVAPAAGAVLTLAPGVSHPLLDGRALEGAAPLRLPVLAAGLHWLTADGPAGAPLGQVSGLPDEPDGPGTVPTSPPEGELQVEIHVAGAKKQVWEAEEPRLPGGAAPPGSPRALAQLVLLLRDCAEVPKFMNLFEDKSAGVRLTWHVHATEVRARTTTLVAALVTPLNTGPTRWDVWHHVGWILANTDQRVQARRALIRALRIWPESPWSWLELARLEERDRRACIDASAPRAGKLAVAERMGLAAGQAFRYLPAGGPRVMRLLRDDASALLRQATEDRRRLQ